MAILQVRNLPDAVYAAVKGRAAEEGITVSDLVVGNLSREVAHPSVSRWLSDVAAQTVGEPPAEVDLEALMDDVRGE